jgi:hypothetical protein
MNISRYTDYSDFISFLISITGLVIGLYLWVYLRNYKISYEFSFTLLTVMAYCILFECVSMLYAIIRCVCGSKHKRLLTVNIIFSIVAFLRLSFDFLALIYRHP